MTQIKAIRGDTLDSISYRYYDDKSVAMLPALFEANEAITSLILDENQLVNLPDLSEFHTTESLSLWD